jgi:hypothetical protein
MLNDKEYYALKKKRYGENRWHKDIGWTYLQVKRGMSF